MGFKKWLEEYLNAWSSSELERVKKQGIKVEGSTFLINNIPDETILHLYIAYKNEIQTKRLVFATWALAIGTLILYGLTIYPQYFK